MKRIVRFACRLGVLVSVLVLLAAGASAEMPAITGNPVIDAPALLEWPYDGGTLTPNLNDPTSNTLNDGHGRFSDCDLVLSTEGNYHPALHDVWPLFLAKFKDRPLRNWFYTTSPPLALPQLQHGVVQIGNLYVRCKPHVVVATGKVIERLQQAGLTDGDSHPLYTDRGSVLLVKKGNPKNIRSVWDLGREDVPYVSPNPTLEPDAFGNYAATIYHIAANDRNAPEGMTAEKLIDALFNGATHNPEKWLAGPRIHHRDVPWSIAYGKAEAGLILYHLGLYIQQTFPDTFDLIPLGGTIADPQPLERMPHETRYVVRIKGEWTPRQLEAREKLVETLLSDDFTTILERRGLRRPDGFSVARDS